MQIWYNFGHMIKDSPTYRALSNALFSMIGFGWPIILAIFITPFTVHNLGVKEYGVYLFISTFIGIVGILDIGISSALSKFIAEENGRGDHEKMREIFGIGNTIFFGVGIVGALIIVGSAYIPLYFTNDPTITQYAQYKTAFVAGGLIFFTTSIMSIYAILPAAIQKLRASTRVGIIFTTLQQLVLVFIILNGYGTNALLWSSFVVTLLSYFAYRAMAENILPHELKKSVHQFRFNGEEIKKYYSFGIGVFVSNVANSSLTYLDKMIIPLFLGPSNLSYYSLAGSIANKTPAVSTIFSNVIFPMTASFEGAGDRERTKQLYVRSMRLMTVLSMAITVTIIAIPYKMLQYWISEDVAIKGTAVLILLAWTNFFLSLTTPLTNFLIGAGRLKQLAKATVTAAILNALLLLILLPTVGLNGAAWAYILALIPYLFLFYWTETHLLELPGRLLFYAKLVAKLVLVSAIVYIIDTELLAAHISNFKEVVLVGTISVLLFLLIYRAFGFFEKRDVDDIQTFAKHLVFRKRS